MNRILSSAMTSMVILTLAFPAGLFARERPSPEANPGVTTTEFKKTSAPTPAPTPETITIRDPITGKYRFIVKTENGVYEADEDTKSEDFMADAPKSTPDASPSPAPSSGLSFGNMSCDDRCSVIEGKFDALTSDPVCNGDQQCRACVVQGAVQSMAGRYCQARTAYKKARGEQTRAIVLYGLAFAACTIGCVGEAVVVGKGLQALCVGGAIASAVNEIAAMKKVASIDKEVAGWAVKADQSVSKLSGGLAAMASVGMLTKTVGTIATTVTGTANTSYASSCIAAPLLAIPLGLKSASMAQLLTQTAEDGSLCRGLKKSTEGISTSVASCTAGGLASNGFRNTALDYKKPEPFFFNPSESDSAAAMGDGIIADLYKNNEAEFKKDFEKLPTKVKSRIEGGENPIDVLASEGFLTKDLEQGLRDIVAKAESGEKSAFYSDSAATATIANAEGGKSAVGSGVFEDSFGTSVAASAAGEGVSAEEFGNDGAMGANGSGAFGQTCGQGHLHEGCTQSIFRIVSDQLSRKSKDESVAQLNPVLPLNQMRAGLKVETKRAPASAPSKVK